MKSFTGRASRKALLGLSVLACSVLAVASSAARFEDYEQWDAGMGEAWFLKYDRYAKADVSAAKTKWAAVEADAAKPPEDEWAGYYSPDHGGETSLNHLRWSPGSGYVNIYVYTCMAELRFLDFGNVVASDATVRMIPEYPAGSGRRTVPVAAFVKVKWGGRRYLIEESQIAAFCDAAAGVGVFEEGKFSPSYWVMTADAEKSAEGPPLLPPEYRRFLKKPIDAEIISVGKSYTDNYDDREDMTRTVTRVKISAGSRHGVKAGIAFRVLSPKGGDYGYVKVVRAGRLSSDAIFVPSGFAMSNESPPEVTEGEGQAAEEEMAEEEDLPVAVGWKLTTRPPQP